MSRLRVALPALEHLSAESLVQFAWLDRAGQASREGQGSLAQLGLAHKALALECFLHPQDSLLTSLELPLLPTAKVAAAVNCAAQALILGPLQEMHVAHGPRESNGLVQIAWLPKVRLAHLGRVLAQVQLKVRGLYPAPYALALPPPGRLTVALAAEHLLLRHSLQQGAVHPLGQQALQDLLASGAELQWVGEGAPATAQALGTAQRWSGAAPTWGLHGGLDAPRVGAAGWGRALACGALAVAIWALGLNLYAARQAEEGQRLKAQMSQRVKQAFPELPVILNPLQQARQQLAARQSGTAADPGQRFASLLQLAGKAMPFMVGGVQQLEFEQGRLHLRLSNDSQQGAPGDWQAALTQAGFAAVRDEHGWTLGPLAESAEATAAKEAADE